MSENETIAVEFKSSREFPMSLPPFIPRNRRGKEKRSTRSSRIQGHDSKKKKKKSIPEIRKPISLNLSNVGTDPEE